MSNMYRPYFNSESGTVLKKRQRSVNTLKKVQQCWVSAPQNVKVHWCKASKQIHLPLNKRSKESIGQPDGLLGNFNLIGGFGHGSYQIVPIYQKVTKLSIFPSSYL